MAFIDGHKDATGSSRCARAERARRAHRPEHLLRGQDQAGLGAGRPRRGRARRDPPGARRPATRPRSVRGAQSARPAAPAKRSRGSRAVLSAGHPADACRRVGRRRARRQAVRDHAAGPDSGACAALGAATGRSSSANGPSWRRCCHRRNGGRVVRRSPTVVLDAAHNPAGARATAAAIQDAFSFTRLVGVVAVAADKDVRGMLEAFEPLMAEIVVTEAANPRHAGRRARRRRGRGVRGRPGRGRSPAGRRVETAVELAEEEGHLAAPACSSPAR